MSGRSFHRPLYALETASISSVIITEAEFLSTEAALIQLLIEAAISFRLVFTRCYTWLGSCRRRRRKEQLLRLGVNKLEPNMQTYIYGDDDQRKKKGETLFLKGVWDSSVGMDAELGRVVCGPGKLPFPDESVCLYFCGFAGVVGDREVGEIGEAGCLIEGGIVRRRLKGTGSQSMKRRLSAWWC